MEDESGLFIDSEFEEEFEPCNHVPWQGMPCGSRRRIARLFLDRATGKAARIGFLCDQEHKSTWETGGIWIPRDVFGCDGEYPAMFSSSLFPVVTKRSRSTSFEINDQMQYRHRTASECAVCYSPPFTGSESQLYEWLMSYRADFYERILAPQLKEYFERTSTTKDDAGWYEALPAQLRVDIERHKADSKMTADHGIPHSLLDEIRTELSSIERQVARGAFTFPLCLRCNRQRRNILEALRNLWWATKRRDG
jgi:hypothetical protein